MAPVAKRPVRSQAIDQARLVAERAAAHCARLASESKTRPAVALITAIVGTALSIALVQHKATEQLGTSPSEVAELEQYVEQQLERLNQTMDPYRTDPYSGAGAPNSWPSPQL